MRSFSPASAPATRAPVGVWRRVRDAFSYDVPFLLLVAAYVAAAFLSSAFVGIPRDFNLTVSWRLVGAWTLFYLTGAFLFRLVLVVVVEKRTLYAASTWKYILGKLFSLPHTASYAVILLVLPIFMKVFVAYKGAIPTLHPFEWDEALMRLDRIVHLGRHPWIWLQPILGRPVITKAIDFVYYLWFPILWMSVIWQAWHGSRTTQVRGQFLVSFALCWMLLGTVLATVLSSAGPVYYAGTTGQIGPYGPLMEYLRAAGEHYELRALWAQDILWNAYTNPEAAQIEGISAMPSMHVSMGVLLALLGFQVHRVLGILYSIFGLLIFVGSVHLAWHYALDGYVAALGTVAIWWSSGRIVKAWTERLAP